MQVGDLLEKLDCFRNVGSGSRLPSSTTLIARLWKTSLKIARSLSIAPFSLQFSSIIRKYVRLRRRLLFDRISLEEAIQLRLDARESTTNVKT